MVGVTEVVLILGALALDVYAYKKMKDAEELAEQKSTRVLVSAPSTTTVSVLESKPQLQPAASLVGPPSLSAESESASWKPAVTYEATLPQGEELRLLREEVKNDFQNLNDRIDVLDERFRTHQTRVEEKFDAMDNELQKVSGGYSQGISEEKMAEVVAEKVSQRTSSLSRKLDEHYKKLLEVENKVDSALISAPDTVLIKKDLREEFAPLFKTEKKMDDLAKQIRGQFVSVGKKIVSQRRGVLRELEKRIATRKPKVSLKAVSAKRVKKKIKTSKKAVEKKAPETRTSKKAEVTVTTKVPKGVRVSTEVVTGKKK